MWKEIKKNLKKWIFALTPSAHLVDFFTAEKAAKSTDFVEKKAAISRCKPAMPVFRPKRQILSFQEPRH